MIINDKDILDRSRRLARSYARKVSATTAEDLTGAASVAQLEAAKTFDETRSDWRYFAGLAASRAIRHEMRLRYPVSGARSRQSAEKDRLRTTVSVEHVDTANTSPPATARAFVSFAEAKTEDEVTMRAIRARMAQLLGEDGALFALAVLTGEIRPAEFAEREGVTVREVNAAQRRVRKKLMGDSVLLAIWRDL